jgi:hypothetical protein
VTRVSAPWPTSRPSRRDDDANLAERYRHSIADLAQVLSGDAVEIEQARDALRCLIDAVVATPATEGRGVVLEVSARLAAMVGVANDNSAPGGAGGCMLEVVAGAGFVRKHTLVTAHV